MSPMFIARSAFIFCFRLNILRAVILIITCMVFASLLKAQDQNTGLPNMIPPSPNAYEVSKFGQLPVGLFSGTINIDIPVFTYKTKNLSIPISLDYSSNGIKVDQIASVLGLGWNLSAGGLISRIVRDEDDQDEQLFIPEEDIATLSLNNGLALDYFKNAADGSDSEPDLYLFNFNGYSGQFIFDNNNTGILIIPAQALKIETYCEGPACGFRITTPDGLKYVFLDSEITESRINGLGHSLPKFVENAWYLTKVVHPNGDEIYFHYAGEAYSYISGISESIDLIPFRGGCNNRIWPSTTFNIKHFEHFSHLSGKRLASISSNTAINGEVVFAYEQNDPEIAGYSHLSKISLLNSSGSTIESMALSYLCTPNKRIFLKEVVFKDIRNKYAFEYDNPSLFPYRLSFSQDHWGFFNNKQNFTLIPKPDDNVLYDNFYNAADRSPVSFYARIGMLKKVVYPTKGYSEITYEPNTFFGNKKIPPHKGILNLESNSYLKGYKPNSGTIRSLEDQYVELFGKVSLYIDPDENSFCNPTESTGHEKAFVRIYDLTTGRYIDLLSIAAGAYMPADNPDFTPNGRNRLYAFFMNGHTYRITLSAIGICTQASVGILYIDKVSEYIRTDIEAGGSRVRQTLLNNLVDNHQELTRYYYGPMDNLQLSSGDHGADPKYYTTTQSLDKCDIPCDYTLVTHVILNSSSLTPLFNSGNSNICYKYVSISNGGDNFENGGSEHEFIINRDTPGNLIIGNNYITGATWSNTGWDNSLEKQVRYFVKNESGALVPVRKTENFYTADDRNYNEAYGYAIHKNYELYCSSDVVCTCTEEQTHEAFNYYSCIADHKHVISVTTQKCISFNKGTPPNNVLKTIYSPCFNHPAGFRYINTESLANLDVMSYKVISRWSYLNKSISTDYDLYGQETMKTEKSYSYDNENHMQMTQMLSKDSKGQNIMEKIYYPDDIVAPGLLPGGRLKSSEYEAINKLKKGELFRISEPVQKELYVGGSIIKKSRFLFGEWHNLVLPSYIQIAAGDNPLESRMIYKDYDDYGNLLQVQKQDDIPVSFIYGYNNTKLIAETKNATTGECGYTGFENDEAPGWQTFSSWRIVEDADHVKTGKRAMMINGEGPEKYFAVGTSAGNHCGYKASVWVKGGTDAFIQLQLNDNYAIQKKVYNPDVPAGSWNLLDVEMPYALYKNNISASMKIKFSCGSSGPAWFDDLRFYPMDARMNTYTYDPIIGMTSASDVNNKPTIYEYDAFGRLKLVRDFLGDIIKKYDYHIKP